MAMPLPLPFMTLTLTVWSQNIIKSYFCPVHPNCKIGEIPQVVYKISHSETLGWHRCKDRRPDNPANIIPPASKTVVTWEIKLFWNNFEITSVYYFTCNHWCWLHVKQNTEIISKLFHLLKELWNYFSDIEHVGKYSWAVKSFWNNFVSHVTTA